MLVISALVVHLLIRRQTLHNGHSAFLLYLDYLLSHLIHSANYSPPPSAFPYNFQTR